MRMGEQDRAAGEDGGPAARASAQGIARRWRVPAWLAVWSGVALTVFAFACPAMIAREDQPTLAVTQVACMLRTFGLQAGVGALLVAGLVRLAGLGRAARCLLLISVVWLAPEGWKFVRPVPGRAGGVSGRPTLTVLSINALYGHASLEAIEREAAVCGADVVVFQEYTPDLAVALKSALRDYPHRLEMPRDDAFGQGVFSRRAFVRAGEVYPSDPRWSGDPQISVWVEFDGGVVRVTDVHLFPPVGLGAVAEQRRSVRGLMADVDASVSRGEDRIVAGDFNGTPDGHIVGALSGTMVDSWAESSRGRGGTWPVGGVLGSLGKIRIDNLLHTRGLICVETGVGGETGSDHLPTWARYVRRM